MKFEMRCCGRREPLGADRENLWLSFGTDGNKEILSWEVNIASSEEALRAGNYDIEVIQNENDSSRVARPNPALLKERTKYYWNIAAKTGQEIELSQTASFETGIDKWRADWIGGYAQNRNVQNFRREFQIDGAIEQARLYICGLGYFEARLNGQPLDDTYYKPLVTDYSVRNHPKNQNLYQNSGYRTTYYTYDVKELLQKGNNVLSIDVADGYYHNVDKITEEPDFSYGSQRLAFELYITEQGREYLIQSDTNTMVRERNRRSTLYEGDWIDFTKEEGEYRNSKLLEPITGRVVGPMCEDDRVGSVLCPIHIEELEDCVMYDFGENHTGGLKLVVEAEEGDELLIRYAEVLDENGQPNYETSAWHDKNIKSGQIRDIYQENRYILKKGMNEITPMFSWYCYRYAVLKAPETVRIRQIESLFIHTDLERSGHFTCSNEELNRINEMFLQTLFCNMHSGLVTDCPHREKRPYTGDGHLTLKAAYYNLETQAFYYKWLEDILDAQTPEGLIPNTAPNLGGGGGYAWGNAICIVTKLLYCFNGDRRLAEKGYHAMMRWLDYYESKRDADYIIRSNSHTWMLGDWLAPQAVASDVYYISTVCYLMAVDAAIFLTKQLSGKQEQEPEELSGLQELRQHIRDGINRIFFDKEKLSYGNGVQGEDVLALAAGIVPEEYEQALKDKVAHHYSEETDYHLDTGIVLTPILIDYLTDNGYHQIAYRIMTAESYPSYHSLMEGDTTFCEHWSKKWPDYYIGDNNSLLVKGGGDLSHCHPMYGSVVSWLYERVAGLDLTGLWKKKVGIHPYFTDCLNEAKADKITPYGITSVKWEHTGEELTLKVTIPQGLTGVVSFPSQYSVLQNQDTKEQYEIEKDGHFRFELPAGAWTLKAKK